MPNFDINFHLTNFILLQMPPITCSILSKTYVNLRENIIEKLLCPYD